MNHRMTSGCFDVWGVSSNPLQHLWLGNEDPFLSFTAKFGMRPAGAG